MRRAAASVLVMGVCGVGKSTLAHRLADALDGVVVEADDFHPQRNIEAMRAGRPLDDAMRWGWLDALGAAVTETAAADPSRAVVLACSALKRSYRDRLRDRIGTVAIVHLTGEPALIGARLAARRDHFMPPSLLESQIADLEPPREDEAPVIAIDVAEKPGEMTSKAVSFVTAVIGGRGPA
jgi:carbohydrate kinase, thermoresistant glucokinase family